MEVKRIELPSRCRICEGSLIVKIYKNSVGGKQQGLYCGKCGKYHKFLTNDEVFWCAGNDYKIENTYGDLSQTALKNLIIK